jgi:predicted DCC family thiol-disulfide oxidoreductase YuxK
MADQSLAEIAVIPDNTLAPTQYRVLYDGQCEICQACVAWLKALDRENKTLPFAISPEILSNVDSRLRLDECLRQLHVVTLKGAILVGWEAVASLARLFPSTWIIGTLGQWFPFRNIGRLLYGCVNLSSPKPVPNREFMRALRQARGTRIGLPAAKWMLEIGSIFLRTETELVLKSRRVVPGRLLEAGFQFKFPDWSVAAQNLVARLRASKS